MNLEKAKEALVIHLYFTEDNNSAAAISGDLGMSETRVKKIFQKHLKNALIDES